MEDGLSRQALGASRALAAAGWEVGIGSPDRRSVAAASRAVRAWHRVESPLEGIGRFAADVEQAIASGRYDVVFGARDYEEAALAAVRERLSAKVAHPELATVARSLDKLELTRLGEDAGFAVPATAEAGEDPPGSGPWIVKPRLGPALARALDSGSRPPGPTSARVVADGRELVGAVASMKASGDEPLVQETIVGKLIAVVVLAERDHSIVRSYQQHSELRWPQGAGISVRAEVVPSDPGLAERSEALVRSLRWSGLAQMQFLQPGGSEPRLIDFNGRFFGSIALAQAAGSNLADAWARGVLEERTPDPGPAAVGTRYHWAWGDIRRATQDRRGGLIRDLIDVARYSRGSVHSVFSFRDPRPAMRYTRIAGGRARRRGANGPRAAG